MSWLKLKMGPFSHFAVSEKVIKHELKKGDVNVIQHARNLLHLMKRKYKRAHIAKAHKYRTTNDWMNILWSDKTWVTDGEHNRAWVSSE